jgi:S-adenosylmethionine:tRNA ribosyltransferase-isomerase
MNISDFDYHLPPELIAQHPLPERDASRLLLLDRASGAWEDRTFREFPELLRGDELIVVNNARVLPARLFGQRAGINAQSSGQNTRARTKFLQAPIEVLLVRQISPDLWETLVRPGRKIPTGERIVFGGGELEAQVEACGGYGLRVLRFKAKNGFQETLKKLGHIPLPPYIKRDDVESDRERYQTVYARAGSAVAAPTAGLHFTPEVLARIRKRGIEICEITLDVGLGTFEPMRTERLVDHAIHAESYEIPDATAVTVRRAQRDNRPVLAIGTTVVRALEDAAEKAGARGAEIRGGKTEAKIFLYPGRPFRVANQLLTNFHLPKSTLLALVAAFAGRENILNAYAHAVESGYRFYSYGDATLIR